MEGPRTSRNGKIITRRARALEIPGTAAP